MTKGTLLKSLLTCGVALGALASAGGAHAQEAAQAASSGSSIDIIVTANKREERLAEVGQAITAVSGEDLSRRNLLQIQDFAAQVPGFFFQSTSRAVRIILRGVNSGGNGAVVAVQVDETPFSYQSGLTNGAIDTANLDTFDMARIEVLKGPQGTLYGASASGGLLKYVTNVPDTEKFEAAGEVGGEIVAQGNFGAVVRGLVNVPFWDGKAALRASGFYQEVPGYVDNPLAGLKNANRGERWSGRISLLLKPTETFTARLTGFQQEASFEDDGNVELVGSNADPFNPPANQFEIANNGNLWRNSLFGNPSDNKYQYVNLTMDLETGFANFLSSTSYGTLSSIFRADISSLNIAPGFTYGQAFGPIYGIPFLGLWGDQENSVKRWNQEFRISSLADSRIGGMGFDWQIGGFYAKEDVTFSQFYDGIDPATGTVLTVPFPLGGSDLPGMYEEFSGFANGTLHLSEKFDVTLGGRYADNRQRSQVINRAGFLNNGFGPPTDIFNPVVRTSENKFTWAASARYKFSSDMMAYARVATGYRPGGPILLIPGAPADFPTGYKSDTVTSYEVGFRGAFADSRFVVDVAAFYLDWTDIQVLTQYISEASGQAFNVQGNAGKARSQGVEWNLTYRPVQGLSIGVVGAYTDAKITEDAPTFGAFSGDRLPNVPRWSNTLNVDYEKEIGEGERAYAGVSWAYTSERFAGFTSSPIFVSNYSFPGYHVVNAQAGVDLGRYSFSLYARNIGDSRGLTDYSQLNGFNLQGTGQIITPRTVGVKIGFRY